jgi:hypothetical protein
MTIARSYVLLFTLLARTNSLYRRIAHCLVLVGLACTLGLTSAQATQITTLDISLTQSEEGYRLSASYDFNLNRRLEDTLLRGVPLYFTTVVEVTRNRWYWFNDVAIAKSRTTRIAYNVLTGQYHVSIDGQLQRSFISLDDALALVRRPPRWTIASLDTLQPETQYTVSSRISLDVSQLPKPFQINAINDSDWHLTSGWTTFTFDTE